MSRRALLLSPLITLTTASLLIAAAAPALAATLVPDGVPEPVRLEISGRVYRYYALSAGEPLTLTVEGPALLEPIMRWRFTEGTSPVDVDVEVVLDGAPSWHRVFRATVSRAQYVEHADWRPGRSSRLSLEIPRGTHTVELILRAPATGTLDVNPVIKPPKTLPYRVEWRAEAGAAYDTNIFRYSDADVDDFLDGIDAEDYQADYLDDFRFEPSVDVSLVRERPGRSQTELRLSVDARLATVNTEKAVWGQL